MIDQEQAAAQEPTPPPVPSQRKELEHDNIVTTLLKAPQQISTEIAQHKTLIRSSLTLLATAIVCHAIFGFAVGLFGGVQVAIMDVVKLPLVALCSLLLCIPSLYVFSCVAGTPLSLSQAVMLGSSCLAMVGLILVGLAPVAWLFAVSTQSSLFVAMLALILLFIAILFAARYVGKLKANPLFQQQAGIRLWFIIITIVALQMATCMRPMIAAPEKGWWTGEKKFFLAHFGSLFEALD